ncbi:D-arabinono-1,4-lactone oxidase [Kineococcus siccus]|uniref:D-arabinono-1,4-lactone oxidase n=1 Tax=Kineococcus siccus TaxID=2696567 RepID=UPI0030B80BA1
MSLEHLPTEIDVDAAARTVRVSGGTSCGVLARELHARGFALEAVASLPHIPVAGGVATGTHGSGDASQGLAAAVRALEVLGADGALRRVAAGEEEFADTDWSGPDTTQVWLTTRTGVSPDAPHELFGATRASTPLHPLPEVDVRTATEQLGVPGPWHERLPHFRFSSAPGDGEELQVEYLVGREDAVDAIEALRALGPRISGLLHMCEIRTVAADDQWLSPAQGRDTVAVHVTFRRREPEVLAALADVEAALAGLGARPHGGELFVADALELASLYPRFDDFRALVARHDPGGTFTNAYLDRVGVTG